MRTQLRLARSRGSLRAPNNIVQDRALEVLEMLEETQREDARLDMVKGLLVSAITDEQKDLAESLFPEYFPSPDPFEQAYDETGEFDIDKVDDSQIEWSVPTPEEDADLSAWIEERERASGGVTTFTAADDGWQ